MSKSDPQPCLIATAMDCTEGSYAAGALRLEAGGYARLRLEIVRQVVGALGFVLRRQREDYPFIDTKFSLVTGEDFAVTDPLRGPGVVYTWIQGRGLEALAKHGLWLRGEPSVDATLRTELLAAIDVLLPRLIASMERIRARCGGRLPFMVDCDGRELAVDGQGRAVPVTEQTQQTQGATGATSLSDLFYSKGLVTAAHYLGDHPATDTAIALFAATVADIRSGRFHFGQVALDPKNPVESVAGRFSHAGRMIGIGGATAFFEATAQRAYADLGNEFIEHILHAHTLADTAGSASAADGRGAGQARFQLQAGDFWEFIDGEGQPWSTSAGQVWSDPGHATEFVGLALAHLRATGSASAVLQGKLHQVLVRNFANGFARKGIVKAFDLASRTPINRDMPWWSLPETMRAAALMALSATPAVRAEAEAIFARCWNAFGSYYVRPQIGFCAVQCLDRDGEIAPAIPATPDADPGYHTGLSLLGCLPWLDANAGAAG